MTIRQDFDKAFGEARSRGDKTFEFRGKTYGTQMGKAKDKVEVGPHGPGSEDFIPDSPKMRSEEKDTSLADNAPMRSEEKDTSPAYKKIPTRTAAQDLENLKAAPGRLADMMGSVGDVKSNYNPGVKMTDSDRELRDVVAKKKGGMIRKKNSTKMSGGGSVRGAGIATKGKGKVRMF
jgi:hypothetical protein